MENHSEMRKMLGKINEMRQLASEHRTAERLWKKADIRAAILVASDNPEKLRKQDAWRCYEFALQHGIVADVKFLLRVMNPEAFKAICEYEAEEIEAAIARATGNQ